MWLAYMFGTTVKKHAIHLAILLMWLAYMVGTTVKNMLFNHQTWVCGKALNLLIGAIVLRVPLVGDVQQSG